MYPKMSNAIQINNQYSSLKFQKSSLKKLFTFLNTLPDYKIPEGDLSIVFLDDAAITHLHHTFLKDPTPTDVITFPSNDHFSLAGEICVSVDHALKAGRSLNIPFSEELTLYLVHGWLHLAGLNDHSSQEISQMRGAESAIMQILKKTGNIPNFYLI